MIVKNEEGFISDCLNSIRDFVDEIILVDTGSTDKTKDAAEEICKNFASGGKIFDLKIIDFKWSDDFSAARNESLRHATKDWVLVLDADELLDKESIKKIKSMLENPQDFAGFSLEQRSYIDNFFEGAVKNDTGFEPANSYPFYVSHYLTRLFKNGLGISFAHKVHELVEDSIAGKGLKYRKIDAVIHHFGSMKGTKSISDKARQYSEIILMQLEENPMSARYNYQAARMFLSKNDFTNALKYFERTAVINPGYKLVFSEIAKIYLKMNDKNRAIEYLRKSIKHNKNDPSPANNLAVVCMSIGKFRQAKEILEEQLKNHPGNKALRYNYEEALKKL